MNACLFGDGWFVAAFGFGTVPGRGGGGRRLFHESFLFSNQSRHGSGGRVRGSTFGTSRAGSGGAAPPRELVGHFILCLLCCFAALAAVAAAAVAAAAACSAGRSFLCFVFLGRRCYGLTIGGRVSYSDYQCVAVLHVLLNWCVVEKRQRFGRVPHFDGESNERGLNVGSNEMGQATKGGGNLRFRNVQGQGPRRQTKTEAEHGQ